MPRTKKPKKYVTPAACYRKVHCRRETDIEQAFRIHNDQLDREREFIMHEPHEGPIRKLIA